MKGVLGCSMQVVMFTFMRSKLTILKPMASGTASTMESSQINTISPAVTVGMPVPCTRDQDTTARYLGSRLRLIFKYSFWVHEMVNTYVPMLKKELNIVYH